MKNILTCFITLFFALNINSQTVQLDPTFGNGGLVINSVEEYDFTNAIAAQSTGKIIILENTNDGFSLIRYNNDGSVDQDFGVSGIVKVDFYDLVDFSTPSMNKLLIEPDDEIVVAGNIYNNPNNQGEDFAVAKFNSEGNLIQSFGQGGKLVLNLKDENDDLGMDIILSKNGGYYLSGLNLNGIDYNTLSIVKLDENGNLDKSFGGEGFVLTGLLDSDAGTNLVVEQSDSKIVAGGVLLDYNLFLPYLGLVRYNTDGTVDDTYGFNGIAQTNATEPLIFSYLPRPLIQSTDNLVVPGLVARIATDTSAALGAIGFNTKGKLNGMFGKAGVARIESEVIDSLFGDPIHIPAVLQPDDKILIANKKLNYINLYRLNKDGSLDIDFGNNGVFTFDFEFPIMKSDLGYLYWSKSDNKLLFVTTLEGPDFTDIGIARIDVDYKTSTKEEQSNIENLKIYPNPANSEISLSTNILKSGNAIYTIEGVEGKTLITKDLGKLSKGSQQLNINIADLMPGLYILTLNMENESQHIKFIKE